MHAFGVTDHFTFPWNDPFCLSRLFFMELFMAALGKRWFSDSKIQYCCATFVSFPVDQMGASFAYLFHTLKWNGIPSEESISILLKLCFWNSKARLFYAFRSIVSAPISTHKNFPLPSDNFKVHSFFLRNKGKVGNFMGGILNSVLTRNEMKYSKEDFFRNWKCYFIFHLFKSKKGSLKRMFHHLKNRIRKRKLWNLPAAGLLCSLFPVLAAKFSSGNLNWTKLTVFSGCPRESSQAPFLIS